MAAQTSWNPRECGTYHDLLDREERRLDEAFGGMMPDELPGAVVAVAEIWLDDAYDNITLAQACLAVMRQQEEKRTAALGEHPEPWMERHRQRRHDACGFRGHFSRLRMFRTWRGRCAMTPPRPTAPSGPTANTEDCWMTR